MSVNKSKILFSVLYQLAVLLLLTTFPKYVFAVDAVRMELVPIDAASINCSRTFYKSTSEHKNTIFFNPKIVPGSGPTENGRAQSKTVDVIKKLNGKYIVTLYLYFPRTENEVNYGTTEKRSNSNDRCDFAEVKKSLNKKATEENKIEIIAPLPVTSINMVLSGIKSIGHSEFQSSNTNPDSKKYPFLNMPTLEDYFGEAVPIYFELNDEEYKTFFSNITSESGLKAHVYLFFESRKRNSSISVTFDGSQISSLIKANIAGTKGIFSGDLEAKLKNIFTNKSVIIEAEEGIDGNDNKEILQKVVDEALSFIKTKTSDSKESAKSDNKITSPLKVSLVAEQIKEFTKSEFKYTNYKAPSESTAKTTLTFRVSRMPDPNSVEVIVKQRTPAKTLPYELKKNETIEISPLFYSEDAITYSKEYHYLPWEDISSMGLSNKFTILADTDYEIKKSEKENGNIFHNAAELTPAIKTAILNGKSIFFKYSFVRIKRVAIHSQISSYEYDDIKNFDMNDFYDVLFSFSKINHTIKYSAKTILAEKNKWTAVFDKDRLVLRITAHQDLGNIMLYPHFKKIKQKPEEKPEVKSPKADSDKSINLTSAALPIQEKPKVQPINCNLNENLTKEEINRCTNIPKLVTDSVGMVRINVRTGEREIMSELILNYDNDPAYIEKSSRIKIYYPHLNGE